MSNSEKSAAPIPLPNPRAPASLVLLWAINAAVMVGALVDSPILAGSAILATAMVSVSYMHYRYRRIIGPARSLARAFVSSNSLCGAEMRDLAEAVFRWDHGAGK